MRLNRREFVAAVGAVIVAPAVAVELRLEARRLPDGNAAGFNGASPGPVLKGSEGAPLAFRLANALDEPLAVGILGGRPTNVAAGFTAAPLAAGADRVFTLRCDPGLQLYEAYGGATAARQLGQGLFGALVIAEGAPPEADLDLVAIISGSADLLINGGAKPVQREAPPGGRVRLRLANASPDRGLGLVLSGAKAQVVAIDGQPSELFAPRDNSFPLAPSARIELMFDLPPAGERASLALAGEGGRTLVGIRAAGAPVPAKPPIAALPANPALPREIALERARRIKAELSGDAAGYRIAAAKADRPLFKVAKGSVVSLTLANKTNDAQTLRLEGHVARQLHALDDGWDPYWRDALPIGPGKTLHVAFVADNIGRWPLASASPERRAQGLATWFEVA